MEFTAPIACRVRPGWPSLDGPRGFTFVPPLSPPPSRQRTGVDDGRIASGRGYRKRSELTSDSGRGAPVTQRGLAAEILDLGQTLFDTLIEEASVRGPAGNQPTVDAVEARAAADEFFAALRLLLGPEEGGV